MDKIFSLEEVASTIQHTLVSPEASEEDIKRICRECMEYGFDGAMVQPSWIKLAKKELEGTKVKVCSALGYPMGGASTYAKVFEMRDIVAAGASQIDFMPNFGLLKSKDYEGFKNEIKAIVKAAEGKVTKVMLEFGMLNHEEKVIATKLAMEAGATYLKNSSGWGSGGQATVEDIKLLKEIAGDRVLVKASGGIRDFDKAVSILNAGAVLIGTSSGVKIVAGKGEASTVY